MSNGKHSIDTQYSSKKKIKDKKSLKPKLKWLIAILLIVAVLSVLFFVFFKNTDGFFFKTVASNISINFENDNDTKKVINYETLEAINLQIDTNEVQSTILVTLHNTASEPCPNLNLSIALQNKENENIIVFDAYTDEILANNNQIIKMYTKQDISQVSDISITKKD